jgi:Cupin
MDPLSDVCSSVEVKNPMTGQVRFGSSWAIREDDQSGRSVTLGAALKGSFWQLVDGVSAPIHIQEGDCYIRTNVSHWFSSEPEAKSLQSHSFLGEDGPNNERHRGSLSIVTRADDYSGRSAALSR